MPYGNNRNKAKSLLSECEVDNLKSIYIGFDYKVTKVA